MKHETKDKYILVGKQPVQEKDLMVWARWFETADRIVAKTQLKSGTVVSTCFLGIDHNYANWVHDDPVQTPLLFETLVFEGPLAGEMTRYETWDDALSGHRYHVERCRRRESWLGWWYRLLDYVKASMLS